MPYGRVLVGLPAARVIARYRRRVGFSQERLAAEAGIDRSHVGGMERRGVDLRLSTMNALLVALGCTWAEFGAALDAELAPTPRRRW